MFRAVSSLWRTEHLPRLRRDFHIRLPLLRRAGRSEDADSVIDRAPVQPFANRVQPHSIHEASIKRDADHELFVLVQVAAFPGKRIRILRGVPCE